ncbi:sodium-dependent transporter [Roseivirga misakiensis]|uniref:Transporter n=1 Tax=Roseivirga misakiensis TaxID=1563681 RepID=A0A1E5SXX9_9BACT|nr:sodium-dependent transporter [Roseivirga misakiensis]OEK03979.1 transporter [Roseivirga misakiensis]
MASSSRDEFSSSFGFVMAAAGSAVGLGNIWGFPTQTAENGGAAFVLVYILLAFLVGYPVLMAEFTIGRHTRMAPPDAYKKLGGGQSYFIIGLLGLVTVGIILSFYSIIAGGMVAYFVEPIGRILGLDGVADWVVSQNTTSNFVFMTIFFLFTLLIVSGGVSKGIEKWSKRFMPLLFMLFIVLVVYVLTLDGAMEGARVYLLPDFDKVFDPQLLTSAMGQAFFSLSLGVGGMLVYGSYTSDKANLTRLGWLVTLCDIGVAIIAGFLIIPAMYAASSLGTEIFDANGALISGPNLIFQVLPSLFDSMGPIGVFVAFVFFLLMSIAALTSSMSMLEAVVAYVVDRTQVPRKRATWYTGGVFWVIAVVIVFNYEALFGLVVTAATEYAQPFLGLAIVVFAGWIIRKNVLLNELKKGQPEIEKTFFYKIWPIFLKVVCPILILLVFLQTFNF